MLLPFHAVVPDKVFPFQLCSMHLFQTSVPCSCSRQSISILTLFHASVPDFRSMQLFQIKVSGSSAIPCFCSRLPFHAVFHSLFHSILCSIPYSIPCSMPGLSWVCDCGISWSYSLTIFFSNRPKSHCSCCIGAHLNVLYDLQHGFWEKRSCKTQFIMLIEKNFQKYMQPRKQAYLWLLVFCGSSLSWYALCVILAFPGHTFGPLGGFFSSGCLWVRILFFVS